MQVLEAKEMQSKLVLSKPLEKTCNYDKKVSIFFQCCYVEIYVVRDVVSDKTDAEFYSSYLLTSLITHRRTETFTLMMSPERTRFI